MRDENYPGIYSQGVFSPYTHRKQRFQIIQRGLSLFIFLNQRSEFFWGVGFLLLLALVVLDGLGGDGRGGRTFGRVALLGIDGGGGDRAPRLAGGHARHDGEEHEGANEQAEGLFVSELFHNRCIGVV